MQNFPLLRGQTITLQVQPQDVDGGASLPFDAVPLTWVLDEGAPINVNVHGDTTICGFQGQSAAPAGTYNCALTFVTGGVTKTDVFSLTIPLRPADHAFLVQL